MAGTFSLDIVTPERLVYQGEVTSLQAPGLDGLFGVLHNRAPLLAALGPGQVTFEPLHETAQHLAVSGGFLQVAANKAVLLADQAEFAHEIEREEAERRLAQAREALGGLILSDEELAARRKLVDVAAARARVAAPTRR